MLIAISVCVILYFSIAVYCFVVAVFRASREFDWFFLRRRGTRIISIFSNVLSQVFLRDRNGSKYIGGRSFFFVYLFR